MNGFFLMVKCVIKKARNSFSKLTLEGKENFSNFFFFTQALHNSRNVKDFHGVSFHSSCGCGRARSLNTAGAGRFLDHTSWGKFLPKNASGLVLQTGLVLDTGVSLVFLSSEEKEEVLAGIGCLALPLSLWSCGGFPAHEAFGDRKTSLSCSVLTFSHCLFVPALLWH